MNGIMTGEESQLSNNAKSDDGTNKFRDKLPQAEVIVLAIDSVRR